MQRLRKVRPSEGHPLAGDLLHYMQQLALVSRTLRTKDFSSGEFEFVSVQQAHLSLADFVHSLPLRRDGRWLAKTPVTVLLFEALAWRPLLLVGMVLGWMILKV